jgi:prepilin-type processing-associated H-X9-DG protein
LCPAPWQGGNDVYCESLTSPTHFTGPNEVWWAPYDNRVGPEDQPLSDFDPTRALLWPFVEGNKNVFQCPDGLDPATGKTYQVSYGMNYVTGGPNGQPLIKLINGSSNILIVWDHGNTPGCANSKIAAPRGPWKPYNNPADVTHYPQRRHTNVYNALYCDGHVTAITQADLTDQLFYATNPSRPPVSAAPTMNRDRRRNDPGPEGWGDAWAIATCAIVSPIWNAPNSSSALIRRSIRIWRWLRSIGACTRSAARDCSSRASRTAPSRW